MLCLKDDWVPVPQFKNGFWGHFEGWYVFHLTKHIGSCTCTKSQGQKYRGGVCGGGVTPPPPILKIYDFAGRQEELYCHTETPPLKFVKRRLRILKWKYYIYFKPPFLTLHFRERNRYVRKSSVICKAKACLTESHSQWMQ